MFIVMAFSYRPDRRNEEMVSDRHFLLCFVLLYRYQVIPFVYQPYKATAYLSSRYFFGVINASNGIPFVPQCRVYYRIAPNLLPGNTTKVNLCRGKRPGSNKRNSQGRQDEFATHRRGDGCRQEVIDFQHELIRCYEFRLDNPEVLVTSETGTARMIASGFANKPGKIDFDRPKTVFQ
jgi:hypothetical protein